MLGAVVAAAVEEALAGYDARVDRTEPGAGEADLDVGVVPADPACAPVWVTVAGDDVDLVLGQGSRLGYSVGAFPSPQACARRIGEVCTAVAEGRFRETVHRRGDRVAAAEGVLGLPDGETRVRVNTVSGWWLRRVGTPSAYPPYPPRRPATT